MRKKLLALLSMVMTVALALALLVSPAFASGAEPVDFAKDSTKWLSLSGAEVTQDGIKTTAAVYNVASVAVGGNSAIEVVEDSYLASGQWGYHFVMVKVNDSGAYTWNPGQTASSGNWFAVGIRHDTNKFAIYESVNGVVSVVAESSDVSGFDNWYAFNQKNVFTINLEDVADGVRITASFTPSDCRQGSNNTGATYTVSYKSANTALWGEGSVVVGRFGGGTASATEYANINVNITDVDSEYPPKPVVISNDSANWSTLNGVDIENSAMKTTLASYTAISNPVGGNSSAEIVENAHLMNATWSYNWVMAKVKDSSSASWKPGDETAIGNWVAIAMKSSESTLYLYECVDGVVSVAATKQYLSGYDYWYLYAQTNSWTISTTDTEDGVNITASFTASDSLKGVDCTQTKHTLTFSSTNKKLWGEGSIVVGRYGDGTVDAENYSDITVSVIDMDSEYEYTGPVLPDFAKDAEKWEVLTGVQVDGTLKSTSNSVRATSVAVGGNSTFNIIIDSTSNTFDAAGWGYDWVIFKADGSFTDASSLNDATGSWLGLVWGASKGKVAIVECKEGAVTEKDLSSIVSGYDNWYSRVQKTSVIITTTDTDDGVSVSIHFEAMESTHPSEASNIKVGGYNLTYESTNKKLWGEQKLVIGSLCSINPTATSGYYYSVKVDDVDSEYSYEDYITNDPVGAVIGMIDVLPTEVSRVNYSETLKITIQSAVDAYEALTPEQQEDVSNSQKLTAIVDALELYEASLAEPEYDKDNLAQDEDNWSRYGNVNAANVSFSNYGMALEGSTNTHKAMLLKNNVKEDSTITVRFDALTQTSWGQSYVMFKMMDDPDSISAANAVTAFEWGGNAGAPKGTWMALMFGNSSALYFAYCIDGEVVKIVDSTIPSSEYNKSHTQITDVVIVTEDTDTGVNVTITFKASGIAGITGETYTLNYSVESTAFHGAHGVAVGTYNGSVAGEKIVVTEFRVTHESGSPFVLRSFGDEVNFASDKKYWKAGNNMAGFEFSESGAALWDAKTGGLLLNQVVKNEDIVKVSLDGTLPIIAGSYGNVYFILRSKEAQLRLNGSHFPEVNGNYVILQIGADGIKIFECANGAMLHDAQLLPTGAVQGGYDLSAGTDGNDIWYVYGNYGSFEFYSEDVDGGVDFYITFNAPSGKIYNFEYFSENEALQGDSYFGIEYFLYANGSSNGLMTLETLRIDGVTEGFVPNVNVAELNAQMVETASTAITVDNVDDVRALYNEYKATYETLNYDMLKEFNKNAFDSILANIVSFDSEINAVEALIEEIDDLPTEVTADNYTQSKNAYNTAKSAYDLLSPYGKTLVSNKSKLDALASAIEAYEINVDAAAAFDALVDSIPELGEDNRADVENAVALAESAYEALTDAQKALTTKHDALVAIRASLNESKPSEGGDSGCMGGFASAPFLALAALVAIRRLKRRA